MTQQRFNQDDGSLFATEAKRAVGRAAVRINADAGPAGQPVTMSALTRAVVMFLDFMPEYVAEAKRQAPAPFMKRALTRRQQRRQFDQMTPQEKAALRTRIGDRRYIEMGRALHSPSDPPPGPDYSDPVVREGEPVGLGLEEI